MTEYDSDDDLPPELEDMSETIAAARKLRSAGAPAAAAAPTHNADLYSAVVDDMSKPEPVAAPLASDTRVKVVGLAKAAQYNGQSGVVKAFDRDAGRYEVVLKSGKELKIKRDNMELVDGAVKGGFLSGKQPKASGATGPEVVRPTGKKEGVLDGMKSLNIDQQKVPEWMKPNEDLLKKVNEDKELASGVNNAKINKAIEEVSKDPQAWLKYQDDPEIKSYFGKMMGLFGKQFEEHEKKKAATAPSTGGAAAAGDPIEEIFTSGAIKTKEAATKKAMIQEISSSGAAEAKRKDMAVKAAAATRRPPSPKRRGTTDYSKWDAIDSDDDEQSAGGGAGGDVLGIPGLNVGKISENDPKVVQAKADPKVQRLLALLRTSADPAGIEKMMTEPDVAEKMRVLIQDSDCDSAWQAGVVDIRRPGT